MARRASAARPGPSSAADSSSLPRRTSLRLAQSSSAPANASQFDYHSTREDVAAPIEAVGPRQDEIPAALEVAIPLKKPSSSRSSSTSNRAGDSSGDGAYDYTTPATSVAMTPAASDISRPKTRVSASARTRELQASTMSLNPRRGRKRATSAIATDDTTPEASDVALARALQLEEYQAPLPKRQKMGKSELEIQDSDDSALTELPYLDDMSMDEDESEQWQPPRNSRSSLRSAKKALVPDSEDSNFDTEDMSEEEADESHQSDSGPNGQTPANENRPSYSQRGSRNRSTANTRGRGRGRRQAQPAQSSEAPTASQTWMSYRAFKERKKLEKQHPLILKMWEDLRNAPPITPVPAEQPSSISRTLKPFQLEGLNWMMQQEKSEYKGGLLGDEMGMGKTIQAVSLLMSDYPIGKPSLVVVPPVALMQWQSEIKEYTNGQLNVLVYHNSNSKVKHFKKKDLQAYDVIMISYSGLESIHRKEWKGWNRDDGIVKEDSVIHSIDYHRLILDEAHSIKQRTTSVARACFALKANYKWCLSGTPVQNRIGEFFSLLRFLEVRPFACYFCKQCKCQQLHWSQDAEKRCTECRHSGFSHVSVFNQEILNPITERDNVEARREALGKLRLLTDRIMLRRVKRDHTASMELPPKRSVFLHFPHPIIIDE
ncbi:DNA repair protein RAD16 [Aspergillus melleus]|uniref:DNA repair protein RAD16 n=1 Tax=Aspergillus melleus TaxID=138277 RepID=UPI001E8E7984|nr:DNA repair protein rad16 [Aspergillus melleus]KAH8432582.1 DNA repair protein rad16 [Aspergillus melleus]